MTVQRTGLNQRASPLLLDVGCWWPSRISQEVSWLDPIQIPSSFLAVISVGGNLYQQSKIFNVV